MKTTSISTKQQRRQPPTTLHLLYIHVDCL